MKIIRKLSIMLAFVMFVLPINVQAAKSDTKVYCSDGFGSYKTYEHTPEGYDISNANQAKIVPIGKNNKALMLYGDNSVTVTRKLSEKVSGKLVLSAKILSDYAPISCEIGFVNGRSQYKALNVEKNTIVMSDNKTASLPDTAQGAEITVVSDNDAGIVSIYVNGRCAVEEWKQSSKNSQYDGFYITHKAGSGVMYIDDVNFYGGTKADSRIAEKSYNPENAVDMYVDQYPNNFVFFDSNYIVTASKAYLDTSLSTKGATNEIVAEKLDYKNVNKGSKIIFRKNDEDTTYNEAIMNMGTTLKSDLYPDRYYYRNYSLEGDFYMTSTAMGGQIMYLRDTSQSPAQEASVVSYNNGILSAGGKSIKTGLEVNRWYHIAIYVSFDTRLADVYLDGELIGSDIKLASNIQNISIARTSITAGKGELQIKDWIFTGLKAPMVKEKADGKETPVVTRPSQFPDDTEVKKYLNGKIVFHGDGNIIYMNDKKIPSADKMVYDNEAEELYVSAQDIKTGIGISMSYDADKKEYSDGEKTYTAPEPLENDGKQLFPVCALSKAAGFNAVYLEYGKMVMLSHEDDLPINEDNNRSWFDATFYSQGHATYPLTKFTQVQEISNYIFYDRPKADKIKADFDKMTDNGSMHPRLLLTPSVVSEINETRKTDNAYNSMVERYIETAASKLDAAPPKYEYSDGLRTLNAASAFGNVVVPLALSYQLTKEEKYARRVIDDLLTVASFPDYNPGHVIDMGMWLYRMSLAYDWCYEAMTDEERAVISDAIIEKGVKVINKAYYAELSAAVCMFGQELGASYGSASFFPKWKSNFIAYTQGGVVLASLVTAEKAPDVCFDTLEKTLRSWEYSNFGFYSGGAWVEGKTYQSVVTGNMAMAMGAMMSSIGDDYNVLEYPGYKEGLDVMMNLSSATASFTYADDSAREPFATINGCYSFYSRYYGDKRLARWRRNKLGQSVNCDYMDIIYYTPDDGVDTFDGLGKTFYAVGGEFFTVHEDWHDPNALFYAIAGGPTRHYHFHNDGGDFLLCMDGQVWSYDLGQGNYNVGTNYTRYGGRTEAHNTLTINPDENFSQAEQSYAEVIKREEGEGGAYSVLDMTSLYAHHGASKVWRGSYISDNYDVVTIRDEMTFTKQTNGYWFMTTKASVDQIDDNTMVLSQNGKTLVLQYTCEGANAASKMSIMEAAPLPTSPKLANDNTANNPDLTKVAIYFEGSGDINLTVRMSALPGDVNTTPISEWQAPQKTEGSQDDFSYDVYADGQKIENPNVIYVADEEDLPDFEIVPHDSAMQVEVTPVKKVDKAMRVIIRKPGTARFAINSVKYAVDYDMALEKDYTINKVADYSVSATPEAANSAPNMLDKSFGTRWTGYNKEDYALFDLGESKRINALAIGFWKGAERKYTIDVQVSDDGENFTSAGKFTSGGETEMYETFNFADINARYVKVIGKGNTVNDVINILECRILTKK